MNINNEPLYKLTIYICTDGDYYYENTLLGKEDAEHIIYYDKRQKAVQTLKGVYSELVSTIESSQKSMQSVIKQIKNFGKYLPKIVDKIPTFNIEMDWGNQSINIELVKCDEIELCGGKTYKEHNVDYEFYIYNDVENAYNWDGLNDIPDIEEN